MPASGIREPIPVQQYVLKVASRCNLACPYCYIYNLADSGWQRQPRLMSPLVIRRIAERALEHAVRHDLTMANLIFHGGEPLLGGVRHLRMLFDTCGAVFEGSAVRLVIGIQSNGTLLTEDLVALLAEYGVTIGISVDGPPEYSDRTRVYRSGWGASDEVEQALELLTDGRHRGMLSGILAVIDLNHDPDRVVDYLLKWDAPACDLLLPLDNHDRLPPGKQAGLDDEPYGRWLAAAFDRWIASESRTRIRYFESIIRGLLGASPTTEAIGNHPVSIVVVETNGEIEGLDSLRSAYEGAAKLGLNVFTNSFDDALDHATVRGRQLGARSLAPYCMECTLVKVCGGGYLPHRYSEQNGFRNPSVYCTDLTYLIRHVDAWVRRKLDPVVRLASDGHRTPDQKARRRAT